jgi:multicomponent Na+:H+ antiporter subunit A
VALLILSPFLLAVLAPWIVARWPRGALVLAAWSAVLAVAFATALRLVIAQGPRVARLSWAPSLGLSLDFYLDGLGLLFAFLIAGIGTLIVLYASRYFDGHPHAGRFQATLFAFMGAMLGVVLSDGLFTLFVFWELTGFTSFLLIGFEHEKAEARAAAIQALVVTGAGGVALLAGALLIEQIAGTANLSSLVTGSPIRESTVYPAIAALVLLAAFTKSAQAPFHFWLRNAMAAPTPVSAYLHSATMVKAGVYLVARMTPVLGATTLWTTALVAVGAITMAGGAWRAVQETDLKRLLAYSTIGALGVLTLLIGVGTEASMAAALVYLLAHACYKGALFLIAGAVEHETGTRDVTALGGLRRAMPFTAVAAFLAAASMAGVPPLLGFLSKDAFYAALPYQEPWGVMVLAAAVLSSVLLGLAGLIAGCSPFVGLASRGAAPHEAPPLLWIPPLVLACLGLAAGVAPGLLEPAVGSALSAMQGVRVGVHLLLWHGLTTPLLLSAVTLVTVAALYPVRDLVRRRGWPRTSGAERVYRGTLAVLDALSGSIAPSLQSASLRSYVLVIVITAGTLVATAMVTGGGMHGLALATDVRPHEVLIVGLIVAGALSAARATTTMAAVLSLGIVGYGVALMFLGFGAPDLAMTQFSVETLTAVIFVLVFRHFPKLASRSPALVRARDALAAAAFGAVIAALVLFVAASGTPSRLAGFFLEAGPHLAHGRNIVNVILVDFRGFDTLGEITVLVSAAIGVHAIFRLASADDSRP